ncbi:MAG: type II toxin-antitoxin system death-on-curing family toxin [Chthoniobacter sp.]
MSEPLFLTFEEVQTLHVLSIERFGGLHGIRDQGGVEAAVEQPKNTFYYGGNDLFDVAAAYAFHIAQAQAFLDGNKRTGVAAALAFLERNNLKAIFDWQLLYRAMIDIAERRCDKRISRGFFARRFLTPRPRERSEQYI